MTKRCTNGCRLKRSLHALQIFRAIGGERMHLREILSALGKECGMLELDVRQGGYLSVK